MEILRPGVRAAMRNWILCRDSDRPRHDRCWRGDDSQAVVTGTKHKMGVMGLQLPRTEIRQEAETLRSYMKFPPDKTRASATGYGNRMVAKPANKRT